MTAAEIAAELEALQQALEFLRMLEVACDPGQPGHAGDSHRGVLARHSSSRRRMSNVTASRSASRPADSHRRRARTKLSRADR